MKISDRLITTKEYAAKRGVTYHSIRMSCKDNRLDLLPGVEEIKQKGKGFILILKENVDIEPKFKPSKN